MDNWLLIIVGTIFLICIAFGYVRGFLKLGLSNSRMLYRLS